METIYNGHSLKSGVYQIRNLNNGRVYIGSAKRFKQRYSDHIKSLIKGTHHNKYLQNDFNKCGPDAFVFEVLEVVEGEQSNRILVEQVKLDVLYDNQDMCYNFQKKAVYTNGESISIGLSNPESKKIRSENAKKMWQDEVHRIKVRNAMEPYREEQIKTLNKHREDALKKAVDMNSKYHGKVIDQYGNVHEIFNLKKFSEIHDLNCATLHKVVYGINHSHKGWRAYKPELDGVAYVQNKSHRQKNFILVGPDGLIYRDKNIASFAAMHNLNKENLSAVIRGIRKRHKGWTLYVENQLLT